MRFNTRTTTQEWITFLQNMHDISTNLEFPFQVEQKVVLFCSKHVKNMWVQTAKRDAANDLQEGIITPEKAKDLMNGWVQGLTIGGYLSTIRSTGTLAVFINHLGNAVEQQNQNSIDWHGYAVHYEKGVVGVYDPSFDQDGGRLHSRTGVSLVKALVKELRGKGGNRKGLVWRRGK